MIVPAANAGEMLGMCTCVTWGLTAVGTLATTVPCLGVLITAIIVIIVLSCGFRGRGIAALPAAYEVRGNYQS